jgi:hypothetical protein
VAFQHRRVLAEDFEDFVFGHGLTRRIFPLIFLN